MKNNIHILDADEIYKRLKDLPGWNYKDNKIMKEFKFKDFMDSLKFIVGLASIFEMKDHHPNIHIFYSKVIFELQRFDVGGKVTDLDFLIASEIEKLYKEYSSY
ncbi:MAG: 4a-hydroxytetrahydrobiopterin dehydratase [Candidatus Nanoarchaeia archaeon]|nr:4a-hydroxytetrahydrobiopterin dehydratase [Candidatus Nanoarchaeia archaeon]